MSTLAPRLDYMTQYPVESVRRKKDDKGYRIKFGGGAVITVISDVSGEQLPDIEGMSLVTVTRSVDVINLHFARGFEGEEPFVVSIPNREGSFEIEHPDFAGKHQQEGDIRDLTIPPAPVEREADGPSDEFFEAQRLSAEDEAEIVDRLVDED